jgi:hypothetical protein
MFMLLARVGIRWEPPHTLNLKFIFMWWTPFSQTWLRNSGHSGKTIISSVKEIAAEMSLGSERAVKD